MKHPFLPATTLAFLAACAGGASPSTAQTQRLAEAQELLARTEPDPDGALAITDQLLKDQPKWREARLTAGDGFVALSKIDRKSLDKSLVLQDAATSFEQALAMEPKDAASWIKLANVRYQLGLWAEARSAANQAIALQEEAKLKPAEMTEPVLIAARCDLQELAVLRAAEFKKDDRDSRGFVKIQKQTAECAAAALTKLEPILQLVPDEAYTIAAQVYQQLSQPDQALAQLERGIRSRPDGNALHLQFQQLHLDLGQTRALAGAYARLLRENPTVPILRWYEGRALVMIADELRGKGNYQGAIDYYTKAGSDFGQYRSMVPAHAESAAQWIAICELSIARVACDSGDLEGAKKHLLLAEQATKLTTSYENDDPLKPAIVDSYRSHYLGVVGAISKALSSTASEEALAATLQFNESILERIPNRFGFIYNNAALPARDLGVLLVRDIESKPEAERKAAMAKAMDLWERSYRYYESAAKLSPEDPRIVNDCGLMLIYHLNRDFDRARVLFEQAIAAGQKQLDALPADASADERQFLEEATGDAWQNIGVLMARHQHRPFAEVKPFLQKAVTFYPKDQREAAHMLANEGKETPGNGNNPRSLRGQGQGQGSAPEAFVKLKAEVEKATKDNDLDAAMTAIDKAVKELKSYAPFQALRGEYSLRYARAARDEKRKGVELMFEDAVVALKQAVELDSEPAQPRQMLAEAQYDKGDLEAAVKTVSALLLHLQSKGGGKPAELDAAHTLRANAAARLALAQKQEGKDPKAAMDDARASFRYLEQKGTLSDELRRTWAATEQQAGSGNEAVGIYARMLAKSPDDQALLGQIVDTAAQMSQSSAAVDALKARDDATGVWFLGKARFLASGDLRAAGNNDEALAELDRARECFAKSMAKNKDYAASCKQWISYCLGKKGNIAYTMDRFDDAEKWLLEACTTDPSHIADDLGLSESTRLGIMRVADKFFRKQDLGRVESIYRKASDAASGDLDLLNNSGLFARDWGNELERQKKVKEAQEMYEQSYKAYSRAHQLDPSNVRLCNDTALIAIWHLERDWDQSKQMLDTAIAEGQKQLAAIPADKPQQRKDLDEAIGDCLENLALWHIKHSKDAAAAKAAAIESQKHHPGAGRPGARRHLAEAERMLQPQKGK
jgi:regulator of sirC expression with transglutaminase-like and TPR domain